MKFSLEKLLKEKNMSQAKLAEEANTTRQTINNLCTGKVASINFDVLEGICNALDCTPNDLFVIDSKSKNLYQFDQLEPYNISKVCESYSPYNAENQDKNENDLPSAYEIFIEHMIDKKLNDMLENLKKKDDTE